jgi:hypothetical protein
MTNNKKEWKMDDVVNYLTNQGGAKKLLADLGIKVSDNYVDFFKLKFDHFRCGITMQEIPIEDRDPLDIAIDVEFGQPTTDQVSDLVYGYGRSCGLRIILFNDDDTITDRDNLGADEIIVSSLMDAMNKYPVGLYLAKIHQEESDDGGYTFEKVKVPEDEPIYGINDLPTMEKLKEAEFWCVYYDGVDNQYKDTVDVFSGAIHNSTQFTNIIDSVNCETHLVWNNEGVTFSAIVPFEHLSAATDIFLNENENAFDLYRDYEKSITITADKNVKIVVKPWEFPLSRLCVSDYSEKRGYALLIRSGFWKFYDIIEGFFETI